MIIGIDGSRAFEEEKTGTERYSWEMLRALAEVDRENEYVIFVRRQMTESRGQKLKSEERREKEKPYSQSSVFPHLPSNFKLIEIPWPRLWTQGGLAMETWKRKLDVLWVPAHTLPVLGKPSLPMVVTIHGIEYEYLPGAYKWGTNLHLTWSTRWAVKRAQKVMAVSGKTKEDLVAKLNVPKEKVEVVWEGVDLLKFQISNNPPSLEATDGHSKLQTKSKKQRNNTTKTTKERKNERTTIRKYDITKPYILFVGTVQPRKNLVRLIRAFSEIVKWLNGYIVNKSNVSSQMSDVQLVIVGKMGWDYEEILAAPKKLGIEDRVKFLGFVPDEDLPGLYRDAELYVEPSLQEGFGLPVLEAMAAGVPVVAANAGALPEVVGDAGILVDPMSVESMAEGIKKLQITNYKLQTNSKSKIIKIETPPGCEKLSGEKLRKELIKRGRQRVKEFSWQTAAKKLVKIFETVNQV